MERKKYPGQAMTPKKYPAQDPFTFNLIYSIFNQKTKKISPTAQ